MKAKYFQDTDTLYLELRDSEGVETRDLDQDTLREAELGWTIRGIVGR
jgi:uncharacterized protein YuzE